MAYPCHQQKFGLQAAQVLNIRLVTMHRGGDPPHIVCTSITFDAV